MLKTALNLISLVALSICFMTGCSSAPVRTGFLQGYDKMSTGKYLDGINISPSFSAKSISSIIVETTTQGIPDRTSFTADNCKEWLNAALAANADKLKTTLILKPGSGDTVKIKLELAITDINPGNASARILAGEFGAGHAFVQVEGKLIDTATNELLASFVDRRRHSGAAGFQDLGGDAGPALIKALMLEIGTAIISEMKESMSL